MQLSDEEKKEIKGFLDRGEPLPPKYRHVLFAEPHEAELIWPGKTHEVTNVVLPFQSIEQIDEPRSETAATQSDLFQMDHATGRQSGGWTNKLIWGDNKLVLSSLKNGPLRREIENAGGLKLIYIDPPFDVGADFSFEIEVGEDVLIKEPSVIEEIAYRDTWGKGTDSYVSMFYERAKLIYGLLAGAGSLYVHCDWRVSGVVRLVLDEIFSPANNLGIITWKRTNARGTNARWPRLHDTLFHYAKTDSFFFKQQTVKADATKLPHTLITGSDGLKYQTYELTGPGKTSEGESGKPWHNCDPGIFGRHWGNSEAERNEWDRRGLIHWPKDGGFPRRRDEHPFNAEDRVVVVGDVWTDIDRINQASNERLGYDTQKPEALLERVLDASSEQGDLIADFFCGSGTTLAVAEKLGRKWIGCDLGRFAIHTSRKRLIGVQRELKAAVKPYRSFEILNLGKYERQYFAGIDPTLPENERLALSAQKEEHYVSLILFAYKAERVFQSPPFHGRKGNTFIVVGPLDAPVTRFQIEEAVEACRKQKASRLDVLGFEFEMGLSPQCVDEAKAKGVSLALRCFSTSRSPSRPSYSLRSGEHPSAPPASLAWWSGQGARPS